MPIWKPMNEKKSNRWDTSCAAEIPKNMMLYQAKSLVPIWNPMIERKENRRDTSSKCLLLIEPRRLKSSFSLKSADNVPIAPRGFLWNVGYEN